MRSARVSKLPDVPSDRAASAAAAVAAAGRRPRGKGRTDDIAKHRGSDVPQILRRAALDLFASRNYAMVSIKDIAESAAVNASLIYYYFGSKEELFLDLVESTVQEALGKYETVAQPDRAPMKAIGTWIDIHVKHFVLMQRLAKISLDYATTRARLDHIDHATRQFYEREAVILGDAVRRGIAEKVFRPVDVADTVVFISTFLDGALFRQMMLPKFDHKRAIRHMRKLVLEHLSRSPADGVSAPCRL